MVQGGAITNNLFATWPYMVSISAWPPFKNLFGDGSICHRFQLVLKAFFFNHQNSTTAQSHIFAKRRSKKVLLEKKKKCIPAELEEMHFVSQFRFLCCQQGWQHFFDNIKKNIYNLQFYVFKNIS
jgi:hypothetical protein